MFIIFIICSEKSISRLRLKKKKQGNIQKHQTNNNKLSLHPVRFYSRDFVLRRPMSLNSQPSTLDPLTPNSESLILNHPDPEAATPNCKPCDPGWTNSPCLLRARFQCLEGPARGALTRILRFTCLFLFYRVQGWRYRHGVSPEPGQTTFLGHSCVYVGR